MTGIIITLLYIFHKIPLINMLGDRGMGYYSTAFVIYLLFMTFMVYGMPKALSEILTKYRTKGQYALLKITIQSALFYTLMISSVLTLILIVGADVIAAYILKASYSSYALRGIALCIVPASIAGVLHGVFTGTKFTSVSKRAAKLEELFISIFTLLGAHLFSKIGTNIAHNDSALLDAYSALGATIGLFIGILSAVLLLYCYYRGYFKKLDRITHKDSYDTFGSKRKIYKQIIIYMLPFVLTLMIFHMSSLMDYAVFNRIMSVQGYKESSYIILLGMLNGKYEFFISVPLLIISWYMTKKIPEFKQVLEEGNKRKIYSKISQTIRLIMLFVIPCTAIYIIFSTPFMNLLFNGINDTPSILLKTGAISVIFYTLAVISNTVLHVLEEWLAVAKNALVALIIQLIALLLMMIILQWGIIAVVFSRIIFSATLFILNEHTLRERTGYIQEYKKSFYIPCIASIIMSVIGYLIYFIFELFIPDKFAFLIALVVAIPVYIMALVFIGGITQREMYKLPGGKLLAPLCRKLHLIK